MKHKQTKTCTYTEITAITCDICRRATSGEVWTNGDKIYGAGKTQVFLEIGEYLPDCSNGELIEFDICPDCFRDKLMPVLQALGAKPTISEWDR